MKSVITAVVCIGIIATIPACSSSKEQAASDEKAKKKSSRVRVTHNTEPVEAVSGIKIAEKKQEQEGVRIDSNEVRHIHEPADDSLVARIERTACFGTCPIYELKLYRNGFVFYKARKFGSNGGYPESGTYVTKVSADVWEKIKAKADEVEYWKFAEKYDASHVADIPTTITYLISDNREKQVINENYKSPKPLLEFEKYFDSLFQEVTWYPAKMEKRE